MLSDLFFTVNYYLAIGSAIIGLTLCLSTIVIVITHRECHNFTNALACNTSVAVTLYFILRIVASTYGLRGDWQYHQPACVFCAYCSLVLCAALCYSYSSQVVSRLFFAVLYKHKFLLTWRAHRFLIATNWVVSTIIPIRLLLHPRGFELELESSSCVVNPKIVSVSMYVVLTIFVVPLSIVTVVYGLVFHRARQSTRRVTANVIEDTAQARPSPPNSKRELQIMKNMSIQTTIISLGGALYLVLVIWYATANHSPPESFYLLAVNLISISTALMMIVLFTMNKAVKKIALGCIFRPAPPRTEQQNACQPMIQFNLHQYNVRTDHTYPK